MNIKNLRENHPKHWDMATALRMIAIDAVQTANSGHPGMPMGMADVATVLYKNHIRFDPRCPEWPDRDRFILSAGHGSMLLYGLLYLTGYKDITLDDLKNFRQLNSKTAGHPEYGHAKGIETTTGPLGQGLATAVGMAIAEEMLRDKWGTKIVSHRTYVIAGDGCLMEGLSQEAIALAGKQRLENLIVFWDDNGITIDGEVSKSCTTDQKSRFKASNWSVFECDGHDPESINTAINAAKEDNRPSLIDCKTHIGFGSPNKQDTANAHGAPLGTDEIKIVKSVYGWDQSEFEIPEEIKVFWKETSVKGELARKNWDNQFSKLSARKQDNFLKSQKGEITKKLASAISKVKNKMKADKPCIATRKSSEAVLEVISVVLSETVGGSADLTGSNNTLTKGLGAFDDKNRAGRYIYYGIREHGMAAAMNGISLHGGLIPYGGTFMAFTDYARGAIRLSALMGQRVIYVMTHDSIGLGEDGPTHQPVEHLAMLRATPNLNVFRPADSIETAEAWELALRSSTTPSVLALTRQNLPTVRTEHSLKNLTAFGGYILAESKNKRKVVLIATGSEVSIAIEARNILEDKGIGTRVVSMPCWELFEKQDPKYQKKVLGRQVVRIGVEAGVQFGWEKWLISMGGNSNKYGFIGMKGFGASAPAAALYNHFGITSGKITEMAEKLL